MPTGQRRRDTTKKANESRAELPELDADRRKRSRSTGILCKQLTAASPVQQVERRTGWAAAAQAAAAQAACLTNSFDRLVMAVAGSRMA